MGAVLHYFFPRADVVFEAESKSFGHIWHIHKSDRVDSLFQFSVPKHVDLQKPIYWKNFRHEFAYGFKC